MGDPAGIGAEIIVKAFAQEDIYKICNPVVIGDRAVIKEVIKTINIDFDPDNIEILNLNEVKTLQNFTKESLLKNLEEPHFPISGKL